MGAYEIVRQAILKKMIVIAWYDGYERIMCPHVLGTKKGRPQALFYQFGGGSRSGLSADSSPDNWRCLSLDQLTQVRSEEAQGNWHSAPDESRPTTCVDQIDVQVM